MPLLPRACLLLLAAVGAGCGPGAPPATDPAEAAGPAWFADVTKAVGVDFVHDPGPTDRHPMPAVLGSGCAVFDADGDGRLDLLLLQNGGPKSGSVNRLYLQKPDGTFRDASAGSGVDFSAHCMGAAVGDVNNDGRPDLLITEYPGARLLLNQGGGKFSDASAAAGVVNPHWGSSAAMLDFDRDGWLDIVVVNYVDYDPGRVCASPNGRRDFCHPMGFGGTPARLFRNLAAKGGGAAFEDVTLRSGVGATPGPGLGVLCADLTGDGWPDVFVANDGSPNYLWVNGKDGTFREEATSRGAAYTFNGRAFAGMGVAGGDFDGDGLLDLFVTHLGMETNTLWKQGPRGVFRDRTAETAAAATRWRGTGFGAVAADFDHDGLTDLALVNGRVSAADAPLAAEGVPAFWRPYAERNQVLANAGGRFRDVSAANPAFCAAPNVGRGLACGDLDGDGAPDLVATSIAGPARVYRNVCPGRGHWLKVRALDATGRDAVGAEVVVAAGAVRRLRLRLVASSDSIFSSSPAEVHFGLGAAASYDSLEVLWPDGSRERFPGGAADRAVSVARGRGSPVSE